MSPRYHTPSQPQKHDTIDPYTQADRRTDIIKNMLSINKLTLSIISVKSNAFKQIPVQVNDIYAGDFLSTS